MLLFDTNSSQQSLFNLWKLQQQTAVYTDIVFFEQLIDLYNTTILILIQLF